MRAHLGARPAVLSALIVVLLALPTTDAAVKSRTVLVLPFATVDLSRDEQWLGEGVAQSLMLALAQAPSLVQIDRERLRQVPPPESWDDQTAATAAKALHAEVALFGEVRRVGGDLTIQPRYLEFKGDRPERAALEVVTFTDTALMERLRTVPVAYTRVLKVPLSESETARVQKWASPTSSMRAFEAYVRGRQSWYRGTQEGNEAAIEFLGKAIEIDPQFVVAQYALGVVHQTLGNRWKAAAQFRASTQLDPTYPEPYKALGDLFLTAPRRLFDQVVEAYTKALEIRPFYADAYVGLGDAKAAKGDVDGAVVAYQKALGLNPVNAKVHVSLGKLYYSEKGLYYESVQAYKKAIDLDPGYLDARMGLAEVYEDKGLYQEAIGEYRKVVEAEPKNTGALYNLALVYEKVDPKEAITLWERYIQLAGPLASEKDWVDVARLHLRKLKNQLEKSN
ncbi:MAG TPA: tetratricopeptide repeat protein [Methylomirabilota bacterium]|jgi:tetratricopeptide (TPR) repeat protein|nr:tetratricopeptide repeat protein [Methylomirabilota bacterium]